MTVETRGLMVGAALVIGSAVIVGIITDSAFLDKWQTLIAGALALGGAMLTIGAIRDQIGQAKSEREDQIERHNNAARAVLPFALISVSAYAVGAMTALAKVLGILQSNDDLLPTDLSLPTLRNDIVPAVRDAIEVADYSVMGELAALLYWLQIVHSRVEALGGDLARNSNRTTEHWIAGLILDASELDSRCSRLFIYARSGRPSHTAEISRREIQSNLFQYRVYDADPIQLGALIETRYPKPVLLDYAPP